MRPTSAAPRPRSPRRRGSTRVLVAIAAIAAGALVAFPTVAGAAPTAADRVTFGLTPSSVSGPDGRSALAYAVSPGEVLYDHVAALNYSSNLSPSSSTRAMPWSRAKGASAWRLPAPTRWASGVGYPFLLRTQPITVPARSTLGPGTLVVPITVHVPANATPGDHAGGVLVSLSTTGRNGSGQEITLDQRTGTRVLMTVSGPLAPQLTVTDVHASYGGTADPVDSGTVHLSYTVHNAGNVDLGVALKASVSGLLGAGVHTRLPGVTFLLPGASVSESAQVHGVWPQVLSHASVTGTARTIGTGKSVALAPVTASTTLWTVPWVLVIIVVVLILAVLLYRRRRKKHRPAGPGPRHATTVQVQSGPEGRGAGMRARRWLGSGFARHAVLSSWCASQFRCRGSPGAAPRDTAHGSRRCGHLDVPYTDPDAVGSIGLCNQAGQQITSGSVTTKPFAWRAVSTQPAPAPYNNAGRTATLLAYQPLQDLPAGDWSGAQMTSSSSYTNPANPMAAATAAMSRCRTSSTSTRPGGTGSWSSGST